MRDAVILYLLQSKREKTVSKKFWIILKRKKQKIHAIYFPKVSGIAGRSSVRPV